MRRLIDLVAMAGLEPAALCAHRHRSREYLVAGSDALIERLLADDLLEVVEATLDDPFDGHG